MKAGWTYIGDVCKIHSGKGIKAEMISPSYSNDSFPCYGGNGIRGYVKLPNNDGNKILIGRVGAQCGNIHYSISPFYATEHALVVSICSNEIYPYWLCFLFIKMKLGQYAEGAAQPVIAASKLLKLPIYIPPISEQERIVAYLDTQFAKIDAMKANAAKALAEAKALFQSALTEAMTPKEGWKMKKIGDAIVHLRTGLNPRVHFKLNTEDAEGYYITVRELKGFDIVPDSKTDRVNEKALKRINERSNLQPGDVLFSGTGTIGKTALVKDYPNNWNIKEGVYAMTPKHELLNSIFFIYLLGSDSFLKKVNKEAAGAGVRSIPMKKLVLFEVPIPPLPEQERIVTRLDALSAKVAALEANYTQTVAECDALKQALLREVFE